MLCCLGETCADLSIELRLLIDRPLFHIANSVFRVLRNYSYYE